MPLHKLHADPVEWALVWKHRDAARKVIDQRAMSVAQLVLTGPVGRHALAQLRVALRVADGDPMAVQLLDELAADLEIVVAPGKAGSQRLLLANAYNEYRDLLSLDTEAGGQEQPVPQELPQRHDLGAWRYGYYRAPCDTISHKSVVAAHCTAGVSPALG